MKIYYEPPDQTSEVEDAIEKLYPNIPPSLNDIVKPSMEMMRNLYSEKLIQYFELMKYKVMWALRFIEKDIEGEEGHFLIKRDGGLEMVDFSDELKDKIRKEIAEHYKK